nr:MAG TPA: hypothetical protein [Caudoviricetes sp.]
MDEMNNMNEVTTEETSNEVTPVVTENNEVKTEEKNSGINTWAGVAAAVGVLTIGAIGAGIAKHKAKAEPKVEKEKKLKKHFKLQCPVKIVKDEPEEIEDVDYKGVEETEED